LAAIVDREAMIGTTKVAVPRAAAETSR
jgi:hypothetical protein